VSQTNPQATISISLFIHMLKIWIMLIFRMNRILLTSLISLLLLFFMAGVSGAATSLEDLITHEGELFNISYSPELKNDTEQVETIFIETLKELTDALGWKLTKKPHIVLIKDSDLFAELAGNRNIAAYVVSKRSLVVIDYERVLIRPFTLRGTLKHELVHLILGDNLPKRMPRWLNEGVAQWLADSPAELVLSSNNAELTKAALQRRLIPLRSLENSFPSRKKDMILAYEQSRSIVEFTVKEHGKDKLLLLLNSLQGGASISEAIISGVGVTYADLEASWAEDITLKASWFYFIAENFLEVLFLLAALAALFGFIRMTIRIRTYKDDENEVISDDYLKAIDDGDDENRPPEN
jgi:hypothetical protein